ncbi:MAG TPA: rRNA maturation RNase YbeY [Spirochaetes bacterium]|mgnify:CR=1 FL=1|nr:rRNA maturation RNase YbeY [Spirochaetota bacterium]
MMKALVFLEGVTLPYRGLNKKKIVQWAGKIGTALSYHSGTVAVILTDNHYMRNLNRTYRKKDRPTDVISFNYREEPFPETGAADDHLGDVYISLEKAGEQAVLFGVDFSEEFKRLLTHGMLHLAGFDHEKSARDAKAMRSREDEILSAL